MLLRVSPSRSGRIVLYPVPGSHSAVISRPRRSFHRSSVCLFAFFFFFILFCFQVPLARRPIDDGPYSIGRRECTIIIIFFSFLFLLSAHRSREWRRAVHVHLRARRSVPRERSPETAILLALSVLRLPLHFNPQNIILLYCCSALCTAAAAAVIAVRVFRRVSFRLFVNFFFFSLFVSDFACTIAAHGVARTRRMR